MIARAAAVSRSVTIWAPSLAAHGMLSGREVPYHSSGNGFCAGFMTIGTWSKS